MSRSRRTALIVVGTLAILLVPLVASGLGAEVAWSGGDFLLAAGVLAVVGLAVESLVWSRSSWTFKLGLAVGAMAALLLLLASASVGVIGDEDHPANLLCLGTVLLGAAGSLAVRLRPRGMARVTMAMAVLQFMVPPLARILWGHPLDASLLRAAAANLGFVAMFLASSLLLQRAASEEPAPPREDASAT